MQNPGEILSNLRNSFNSGVTKSREFREKQLKNLLKLYDENTSTILEALKDDLNKSNQESIICEIDYLRNDALNMLYNLSDWMKPESTSKDLANLMNKTLILSEPYGVALVIGAWNYPIQLCLSPLTGAIAAGNCALIKPSELAPACAKVIAELIPEYLDNNCYKVYQGGPTETQKLLELKFDYIFYTGSPKIATIIAQAAAKHLTPTTLELGGKSPCYLDSTVDVELAAGRIFWGKTVNAGQTCIAPDYLLCTQEVEKKFIEAFKKSQKRCFGNDVKDSPDYCRIINNNHFNRLVGLLQGQEIAHGGAHDASQKFIEPTICVNVNPKSPLMQDEIFGPILPILRVDNAAEAVNFINAREKPLALYVFSNDKKTVKIFEEETSSGGITVNDTLMHFVCDALPFGGVGNSGCGAYHGKFSFDTFSHKKAVLETSIDKFGEMTLGARYAPYSETKIKILSQLTRKRNLPFSMRNLVQLLLVVIGMLVGYFTSFMSKSKDC